MAKLSKIINTQKSKLFWLYIVVGILFVLTGIILAPFWIDIDKDLFFAPWGHSIVKFVISGLILLYVGGFLIKKIVKGEGNGVIKVLIIIETALLLLIALGGILSQFNVLKVNNAGQILGLALWLRGTIEVFRAYYFKNGTEAKYPVWWLVIAIVFISIGVAMFITNFLSNVTILWILVSIILILGVISIVVGFIKKPNKTKSK